MTHIELDGVRVHNLRGIGLTIPHNAVTVICGVSGSGKSSLAFDTLFAEGQRRYAETFSPQARQFLNQLERPDVDRLEGIPPAIGVQQQRRLTNLRSTVGSRTEILRYLQLLFAQLGVLYCPRCKTPVRSWTPDTLADELTGHNHPACIMITFLAASETTSEDLVHQGYTRGITGNTSVRLEDLPRTADLTAVAVVADRIQPGVNTRQRIFEGVRQVFERTMSCRILIESPEGDTRIDGRSWHSAVYSASSVCTTCQVICPELSQDLFSFYSVLGACTECQGSGESARASGQQCSACDGTRLNQFARSVQLNGASLPDLLSREAGSLADWLEDMQQTLSDDESRALATVIAQLQSRLQVLTDIGLGYLSLSRTLKTLSGGESRRVIMTAVLRSGLINTLYVLDEPTSGMHQSDIKRINTAIRRLQTTGNTVVVVEHDLHVIQNADRIVELGPQGGRDGGQIVFEGTPQELLGMDTPTGIALREFQLAAVKDRPKESEIRIRSPQGEPTNAEHQTVKENLRSPITLTTPNQRQNNSESDDQWLMIRNVRCHNIDGAGVDIPLQVLCAVTGVSGSGKSSLIADALYPELECIFCNARQTDRRCEVIDGIQHLSEVQLLEQNPLQRSSRSIPATYLGAFDDIRRLLAETYEARKRNFKPGTFSFNSVQGGRCEACQGQGTITIDMQFLADVSTTCENCRGRRFRKDVLEIRYRDRSVDEILSMTAVEAFTFFNGHRRIQKSLNGMRQAGLGYLTLGQPLSTLSGGEAQRLRIAALLSGISDSGRSGKRSERAGHPHDTGTLFILDEPSAGLHARDTDRLMNCLRQLVQVGHSVVMIEHDRRLIEQCDHQIILGPGPGNAGGRVIGAGPIHR